MDIYLSDPSEIPLPPTEIRIREIRVEPDFDHNRVHLFIEVDPFQRRPNLDFSIIDRDGREIVGTSIIESMVRKIELTMHLRGKLKKGNYRLMTTLYYVEIDQINEAEGKIERSVIDEKEVDFNL